VTTDVTTTAEAPVKKREPKKAKPPLFKVGDVVKTRYAVKVPKRGPFRRTWLYLLPGAEWEVVNVEDADKLSCRPLYTLTCAEFTIHRREYRLQRPGHRGSRRV
jgi:hypothetical protein